MRLRSLIRPCSLYGQLMLALLLGAAVLQGVNFFAVCYIQRDYSLEVLKVKYDYDATIFLALQKIPPERRMSFLNKIAQSHDTLNLSARFDIIQTPPDWNSDRSWKTDAKIEEMKMAMAAGAAKGIVDIQARLVKPWTPGAGEMGYKRNEFPLLQTAVQIDDENWLEITQPLHVQNQWALWMQRLFLLLESIILSAAVILLIKRATGPLRRFASVADAFGSNPEMVPPLEEIGNKEIREAAQSFNRMRQRICDNMNERNRMLEAMGHDLRTPLARAQLRLEKVKPEELQSQLTANINEIQSIVEQGLELARSLHTSERAVRLDVVAFVQSLVDDAAEGGADVSLDIPDDVPELVMLARPTSLKRALDNLIGNAVKYAGNAKVSIVKQGKTVAIDVDDDGPGIPEELLQKVCEPYYRLEASRNRDSGGTGLGLAIARNMVLLNNGTLTLSNRPEGGLRARIMLTVLDSSAEKLLQDLCYPDA